MVGLKRVPSSILFPVTGLDAQGVWFAVDTPPRMSFHQLQAERLATARRMSDPTASRAVALEIWWHHLQINGSGAFDGRAGFLAFMTQRDTAHGLRNAIDTRRDRWLPAKEHGRTWSWTILARHTHVAPREGSVITVLSVPAGDSLADQLTSR